MSATQTERLFPMKKFWLVLLLLASIPTQEASATPSASPFLTSLRVPNADAPAGTLATRSSFTQRPRGLLRGVRGVLLGGSLQRPSAFTGQSHRQADTLALGTMQQAQFSSLNPLTILLLLPYLAQVVGTMTSLIGNIYTFVARKGRIGWGITGIVWGITGFATSLSFLTFDDGFNQTFLFIGLTAAVFHIALLSLSIFNIVKHHQNKKKGKKAQLNPWVSTAPDGGWQAGLAYVQRF